MHCLFSVPKDRSLVLNPPEVTDHDCVFVEFHCLLSTHQWGFDNSSQVFIRFTAPYLGDFKYCYGPMKKIKRFVNYILKTVNIHILTTLCYVN